MSQSDYCLVENSNDLHAIRYVGSIHPLRPTWNAPPTPRRMCYFAAYAYSQSCLQCINSLLDHLEVAEEERVEDARPRDRNAETCGIPLASSTDGDYLSLKRIQAYPDMLQSRRP